MRRSVWLLTGILAARGLLLRDGIAKESLEMNTRLQAAADSIESTNSTEYQFLRHLRLCATCADFQRVGGRGNGGYVMCGDQLATPKLEGAYSFGIEGVDRWGLEVASRFHVPLYEYDCFDRRQPKPCAGCHVEFFGECINGESGAQDEAMVQDGRTYRTLTAHVARNGQANVSDASLLLKLDVENAEWSVLSSTPVATLRKFRHVNMELHNIKSWIHRDVGAAALQKLLDAGFAVVHLHGNNWAKMVQVREGPSRYQVPDFLEVTMVRQAPGTPCANVAPRHLPQDQKVLYAYDDLPDSILPKM